MSNNEPPVWLAICFCLLVVIISLFIGIVKFMAWWRIAFG